MPYIQLNERPKFKSPIMDILSLLRENSDTPYIKGEYFGYFVNRTCRRYLAVPDYANNSFNSAHFNEAKKKLIANAADSIAAVINRSDPISAAGELNYAITAVLWGFLGQAEGFSESGYGMRTYLAGILERIRSHVETVNVGSQRDMTMAFRRHLVIRGVIGDVLAETYRLRTAPYEDNKLMVNGTIWADGQLVLPQTVEALLENK